MPLGTDYGVSGSGYYVYVYTDAPNGTRYIVLDRSNGEVEIQSASAHTAFALACTLAAADGGGVVELGIGTFAVNSLSVASSVRFSSQHGGILSVNAGQVVTFSGPLDISSEDVFAGSGTVVTSGLHLTGAAVTRVNAKDCGAICDGTSRALSTIYGTLAAAQADYPHVTALTQELDWAAVQAACNYAKAAHAAPFLPAGKYQINDTITIEGGYGLIIEGAGSGVNTFLTSSVYPASVTELRWAGNATDPMFLFKDCRGITMRHILIVANNVAPLLTGVEVRNAANIAGAQQPTGFTMDSCGIEGTDYYITDGVAFTDTGGSDTNNDFNLFTNNVFVNYKRFAVRIGHSQVKGNTFLHNHFKGSSHATYGARAGVAMGYTFTHDGTAWTSTNEGGTHAYPGGYGSITWIGGGMHYHRTADFVVGGGNNDGLSIHGHNSEDSSRLLYVNGPGSNPFSVHIGKARFSHNGYLIDDGSSRSHIVWCRTPGPVTIDDATFADTAATGLVQDIRVETSSAESLPVLHVRGGRIDGAPLVTPFITAGVTGQVFVSGVHGLDLNNASAKHIWPNEQPNAIHTEERSFTETTGAGTYTATVVIPAGATVTDVVWLTTTQWNATTSATLDVGDSDNADGYFEAINLKTTTANLALSFRDGDTGVGAYSAAAGPAKYYSAARTLTATVVTVGGAGAAGRSRLLVTWAAQLPIAATKV